MSTTGKLTPKGKPSLRREASADDPIYKHGFSIGGMNLKNSSGNTLAKNSKKENKKEETEEPSTKTISEVTEEALQQAGLMDEFALPTGKDTKNNNK